MGEEVGVADVLSAGEAGAQSREPGPEEGRVGGRGGPTFLLSGGLPHTPWGVPMACAFTRALLVWEGWPSSPRVARRHGGGLVFYREQRAGGGLPAFCRQRSRSLASIDLVHNAFAPPLHYLVVPGRQLTVGALE